MSGPTKISDDRDGTPNEKNTATKRAGESFPYVFDYDEQHLAAGVELASVGTFTIDPADGRLTKDSPALVTGNRKVSVRLIGGKVNKTYAISHTVTTNETPSQTLDKRFFLYIRP